MTGFLRLVPASEAAEVRRLAKEDFCARFADVMGHALPVEDVRRWWPE